MLTKNKLDEIYACVCPKCLGLKVNAQGVPDFNIDAEIEKLAAQIYGQRSTKKSARNLATKVATALSTAVSDGYGSKLFDVAWDSPDAEQIRHLQQNVYQFSFAKCYEQLKATTAALHDNERIVSFQEFREMANRINGEYSGRYLPIEYNTAIASAQMSSRWVQYQAEKDIFPNLTYRTVGDARVRQSHAALDGLTKPISDPIWATIYPPNGWGCRCDAEQSVDEEITKDKDIAIPADIPAMFKTNLANTGLIFPEDHPYFENLPDQVIEVADGLNPFMYEKLSGGKKGGYVWDSVLHNKGNDYDSEIGIAKVLANKGDKVVFLPEINPQSDWAKALRELVLPHGTKENVNPDAIINGTDIVEFKTSSTNTLSSIKELLRKGKDQSDIICIKLTGAAPKDLKRLLKGQVNATKSIKGVWMVDQNDKLTKYTREDILDFFKSKKQQ